MASWLWDVSFPVCLDVSAAGTVSKEKIQRVLKISCNQKWNDDDDAISLLCHLQICYPIPDETNTYQFPALIEEQRPDDVWRDNCRMTIYVGRRLVSEEFTDIITPGTMPFIQSSARNVLCFQPSDFAVWKHGLMIRKSIGRLSVEGIIQCQNNTIDFIIRGPNHSELQCKKHLKDLMGVGMKVLQEKSPGTVQSLWYISCVELKQLKDFPVAHKSQAVEKTAESKEYSSAAVRSKEGVEDTLQDLLALPDDHFNFLPYEALCAIYESLDKDIEGRLVLAKHLPGFSSVDRLRCETGEELLTRWSLRLKATTKKFADVARDLGLLYLLAILSDYGALELPDKEVHKNILGEEIYFLYRRKALKNV